MKLTKDGFIIVPEIYPNKDDVGKVKIELASKDTLDDSVIKKMRERHMVAGSNKIVLGHLFIECVDILRNSLSEIKDQLSARDKILGYLERLESEDLRDLIEDYGNGDNYGAYYTGLKIRDVVKEKRADMEAVVSMFFTIAGEES